MRATPTTQKFSEPGNPLAYALLRSATMKRSPIKLPKVDVHSVGFQTKLELAAGAVFTALLMRWLM